jgi:D-glycero-D-manno-heptose 1,7-bisphosphate phosphatase
MKIVILDRDGVINEDSPNYIKSVDEWQAVPGSLEAIALLYQAGFRVFIATNQAGVGRRLFDFDALFGIYDRMQAAVAELGGRIDGISYAPEHPDQATEMRKPAPGMLKDIARRLQIGLEGVPFVGDSSTDLDAARAAGARPVLVLSGNGASTRKKQTQQDFEVYDDLMAFARAEIARDACRNVVV